jgi:hypothetical protein
MRPTSMTMPPSLVERPLMPWPPLRTLSGTSCPRANSSAATTSSGDSARITSPGGPWRMYVERTLP